MDIEDSVGVGHPSFSVLTMKMRAPLMVMRILLGGLFKRGLEIDVHSNTVCTMNEVEFQKHAIEQVAKTKVIGTRDH